MPYNEYEWNPVPNTDQAIAGMRRDYDAGTHEICQQKNDDGSYTQMIRKRRKPVPRRDYFSQEISDGETITKERMY